MFALPLPNGKTFVYTITDARMMYHLRKIRDWKLSVVEDPTKNTSSRVNALKEYEALVEAIAYLEEYLRTDDVQS